MRGVCVRGERCMRGERCVRGVGELCERGVRGV